MIKIEVDPYAQEPKTKLGAVSMREMTNEERAEHALLMTAVPDRTPDRLDALESRARDMDRQLREVRTRISANGELIASLASKTDEDIERLNSTDRCVEVIRQGYEDLRSNAEADDANLAKHHERIREVEQRILGLPTGPELQHRLATVEASLARIEDMLTAEKPEPIHGHSMRFSKPPAGMHDYSKGPPRKSLGWINVMPDGGGSILVDDRLSPTREHADLCAKMNRGATRIACIEVFEGDGL